MFRTVQTTFNWYINVIYTLYVFYTGYPNNKEFDPYKLLKIIFILMEMQDAGRGAQEQRKREWGDCRIYNDDRGPYVKAYEASGTKTKDSENDRKYNKVYGRADGFGFVDFLIIYESMRPRLSDINSSNKNELVSAFFLRARYSAKQRLDGTLLGFMNVPMGAVGIRNLWNDICDDFRVPRCTPYGLRQTLCSSYVKSGCHIFEAAVVTKHKSIAALCRYQQDKDSERRSVEIVENYMNKHIDQSTNAFNNHVLRVMGNGNDNDNHNGNQNYNDNHNQHHTQHNNQTIPQIDVSTMPPIPIPLPDISQFVQSPTTSTASTTTNNSSGYESRRGSSQSCTDSRYNPITTNESDKQEND